MAVDLRASSLVLGPHTPTLDPDSVHSHAAGSVSDGSRALCGDKLSGMFRGRPVLVDIDHTMKVMTDETFGPLLPTMKVQADTQP